MKTSSRFDTILVAVIAFGISYSSRTLDGGRVDFYYKPIICTWFILTGLLLLPVFKGEVVSFFQRAWWLQILAPILFWFISIGLVSLHEPFPYPPPAYRNR